MISIPTFKNVYLQKNGENGENYKFFRKSGKLTIELIPKDYKIKLKNNEDGEESRDYFIWDLIAFTLLNIPLGNTIRHKDDNLNNNSKENLELDDKDKEEDKNNDNLELGNKDREELDNNDGEEFYDSDEETDEDVPLGSWDGVYLLGYEEDAEEDLEEIFVSSDEDNVKNPLDISSYVPVKPHHSIYEEFEYSEVEYDLENIIKKENDKLWKIAKYKETILKNYLISEDMELYSIPKNQIISITPRTDGEFVYRFSSRLPTYNLRDILASSFLKTPLNAVISVHRRWNSTTDKRKYEGQINHYTNVRWLTENDFFDYDDKECIRISIHGDLYSFKTGHYILLKENYYASQIKFSKYMSTYTTNKATNVILHIATAVAFNKRGNYSYKYVLFKNGDTFNGHYRNLTWVNTLSGIKHDGKMYTEIPNHQEYVISEDKVPFSFKHYTLKKLILTPNRDGYPTIKLIKDKKRYTHSYHRVVAATFKKDFDWRQMVDHIDRNRKNYNDKNLKNVTAKENSNNITPYKRGREVGQYDLNGDFLFEYENCNKAAEKLGKNFKAGSIRGYARYNEISKEIGDGKLKSYKNFIFQYIHKKEKYIAQPNENFQILKGDFQGLKLDSEQYKMSNLGTIIHIEKNFKLKFSKTDSYPTVSLPTSNGLKHYLIHNLIGHIFVPGKTEEKIFLNHLDENIQNYEATNLQWVTRKENGKYSGYRFGIPIKQISIETGEILAVYDSRQAAAESLNLSSQTLITSVCNGKSKTAYGFIWQNIPENEIPIYPELTVNKRKELYGK